MTSASPGSSENRAARSHEARQRRDLRPEVPDHEILRLIGTGAYGEVWLARSVTGAYRAVKVVWREDFSDESTYVREFEGILHYEPVARSIPGVVHILHVGQNSGKFPYYYYVMELADDAYTGIHIDPDTYVPRTLHSDMELYGRNPMPLDYVLEVGSQLAHALDGMHAEELSHRDVKPSNIVFVNGRAKLADAGSVAHNSNRSFVGTEGYMPPEGPGTPRADVYALAKVLYEMSTGKDRLDFPELPLKVPEGASHRRWLAFNEVICAAAEPQLSKTDIVTALALAERLDSLRQYAPRHKTMPSHARRRIWLRVLLLGIPVCVAAYLALPESIVHKIHAMRHAWSGDTHSPERQSSQLFITSVPVGASIYTDQGSYVDETPYGPVDVAAGQRLSFTLRKDGFTDCVVQGTAPEHGLLALGADLQPYRPPQVREDWKDALGSIYRPDGAAHRAADPVSVEQFEDFLQNEPNARDIPYKKVEGSDCVLTTQAGIDAYTLWLTSLCESQGSLGTDYTLLARPEPDIAPRDGMCAYRLFTNPVQKTPISVHTTPTGAAVWLNGHPLGMTPLQGVRIPLTPFFIEIKMPGFTTMRHSGLSPKDLDLHVTLQPNNSVSFNTAWSNSLGLVFRPLAPNLMAAATEVRVSDYHAYTVATGAPLPPATDFVQSADHPVVNVSRSDAQNFARWLTAQEQEAGLLRPTDSYRLPTDEEWSAMVQLPKERGSSPYERMQSHGSYNSFPWGSSWPPPARFGNYSDSSAIAYVSPQATLEHYTDSFPFSAPVGSFAPNSLGLYDLSGNVQEWVSDPYGGPTGFSFRKYGVTRGGDYTSFRPNQLSSGRRTPRPADDRSPNVGFRLILERTVPHAF